MALLTNPGPLPFLWDVTNNSNGLATSSAVSIFTTELDSLASAAVKVSSVNGTAGVFTTGSFGQAIWADVFYNVGTPAFGATTTAGANLSLWWLTSPDGGTTFESGTVVAPRPPDLIIPLPVATLAANSFYGVRNVLLPALTCKVLVQNNTGTAMPSGATTAPYIKVAPYVMQY